MEAPNPQEWKMTSQPQGKPQTCPMNACNMTNINIAQSKLSQVTIIVRLNEN
jgi:phosphopantetheinyl transferase